MQTSDFVLSSLCIAIYEKFRENADIQRVRYGNTREGIMMKKRVQIAVVVGVLAFSGWVMAQDVKETGKRQTVCPVLGGPINTNQYVDALGKRIYVCCAGCLAPIKADPEKFITKMESEGIVLDQTPAPAELQKEEKTEQK